MREDNVAATYDAHEDAEEAVKALYRSGYDITKLSIIYDGCRIEERILGLYSETQRIEYWGKVGAVSGSIVGLMIGAALFTAPSVTLALVVKLLAVALAATLLVGGLSAAGASACGKLVIDDVPLKYELGSEGQDRFSLVANSMEDVVEARALMERLDEPVDPRPSSRTNETRALDGAVVNR